MSRLKYILFAFILIPLNTAQATEINQQGADRLKSYFQKLLDYQKNINDTIGSVQIEYKGELTVKPQSTYYTATFPHIFIKAPKIEGVPDDSAVFDVGVIKINAMPDDKKGYWKTVITLPSKMTLRGKDPNDDFSVLFKDQRSIALFSEKIGYFTKLDMNISGIKFQSSNQDTGINIGGLQIYSKMEDQTGAGLFSGPGHLLISDLNIAPPQELETIRAKELRVDFTAQDMNLPTLKEYEDKILKHVETLNSLQGSDIDNVKNTDILDMIIDMYSFDLNGFSLGYSLKGFSLTSKSKDASKKSSSVNLGSAFLKFGFGDIKSETGKMFIKTGYDKLEILPIDPEYKDIMPQNINIDIKALKIPYGALTKVVTNTAKAIAANPDSAQMAGIGVLMRLPALLSQAGTKISVEKNSIKNEIYNITLDGKILTDISAITGFKAQFKAIFGGLDNLISVAKKHAANKNSKNSTNFANIASGLENIKSAGKKQKGSKGKDVYVYDIKATPEGKFLINGKESSTVLAPK